MLGTILRTDISCLLLTSLGLVCSEDDVVSELLMSMQTPTIDGLSACGLDTPFTAIFERQERCMAEVQAAGVCMLICPMLQLEGHPVASCHREPQDIASHQLEL